MRSLGKHRIILVLLCAALVLPTLAQASYGTLRPETQGPQVQAMQQALGSLGFGLRADGKYGPLTVAAVTAFQRQQQLKEDGIAGNQTLGRLYQLAPSFAPGAAPAAPAVPATPETPAQGDTIQPQLGARLEVGVNSPQVALLQAALASKGYQSGRSDGVFDGGTRNAVIAYQRANGLSPDGIAGSQTLGRLYGAAAQPAQPAQPQAPSGLAAGTALVATGNTGGLRYRSSAGTGNNVMGTLPNGVTIEVLERGAEWTRMRYRGSVAYVMSRFLAFAGGTPVTGAPAAPSDATPSPSPVPAPGAGQVAISGSAVVATANGGSLRFRSSAGTAGNNVLASIPNGTSLQVIARMGDWTRCVFNGQEGYVMSSHLRFADQPAAQPPAAGGQTPTQPSVAFVRILRPGDSGADVSHLQSLLGAMQYAAQITGTYDAATEAAVRAFQLNNALKADGRFGPQTAGVLLSGSARPAPDPSDDTPTTVTPEGETTPPAIDPSVGKIGGPSASSVKLLSWYTQVKPQLSGGKVFRVYHPASGISFNLRHYSAGRHADAEPATMQDTQLLNAAFGPAAWTPRAVYVNLPDGSWSLATMHNFPHLSGAVSDNGFNGHLCVHFLRDLDETKRTDPNYGLFNQERIRATWKSMTGEVVD